MSGRTLTIEIRFRTPFTVGGPAPADGLDARMDRDDPLPGSSLKGRLRAEAAQTLGIRAALLEEIFGRADGSDGSRGRGGAWWFSSADFGEEPPRFGTRNRVAMDETDPGSGRTGPGLLMFSEHAWAQRAKATVEQIEPLSEAALQRHLLVLAAAARSVTSLGGMRRRGEGWVEMRPDWPQSDGTLSAELLERLLALRDEAKNETEKEGGTR